jgi:tripartite-type tricarboxylate transporter receptor subunit TctC
VIVDYPNEEEELMKADRVLPLGLIAAFSIFSPTCDGQETAPALPKQARIVTASIGGTGPDFIARLMAPKFGEALKINMIVENRPGVNGIVASQYVAKAPSDGSVMMMGNAGTHAVNAALYRKLEYDPVHDFAPISEIASAPLALVIHPVVPAKSIKDLIALARRSPGKLNVAVAGAAGELAGNALMLQAKIDMKNINYKGGSQAALAVMAGEADMVLTSYVVIAPNVEAGKLRVLGVTSLDRMPQFPNVPTIAEGGLPGYEHEQWYALFAPAKTAPAIVNLLNREAVRITNLPDVHERLLATGHRVVAGTPQQLAEKVKREIEKTRRIMQASGMQQN